MNKAVRYTKRPMKKINFIFSYMQHNVKISKTPWKLSGEGLYILLVDFLAIFFVITHKDNHQINEINQVLELKLGNYEVQGICI